MFDYFCELFSTVLVSLVFVFCVNFFGEQNVDGK